MPPVITGAIAGALPGLLQKFAHKANGPNNQGITPDIISNSISNINTGSFSNLNMGALSNLTSKN